MCTTNISCTGDPFTRCRPTAMRAPAMCRTGRPGFTSEKADQVSRECQKLDMLLKWVSKEFSGDEQVLETQLKSNRISYGLLWVYFPPGSLVVYEDPITRQQCGVRVTLLTNFRLTNRLRRSYMKESRKATYQASLAWRFA